MCYHCISKHNHQYFPIKKFDYLDSTELQADENLNVKIDRTLALIDKFRYEVYDIVD